MFPWLAPSVLFLAAIAAKTSIAVKRISNKFCGGLLAVVDLLAEQYNGLREKLVGALFQ